jgi:hypothetical protein
MKEADTVQRLWQSTMAARWKGVIICEAKYTANCYWYLIIFDGHGNRAPRRLVRCMHEHWMREVGTFDTKDLNPDWLKPVEQR